MNQLEFTLLLTQIDLLEAQAGQLRRVVLAMNEHGSDRGEFKEIKFPVKSNNLSQTEEDAIGKLLFPVEKKDESTEN